MKPTTEGSNAFDILCMSFNKEKERGLEVVQGGSKNCIFDEGMFIEAEDGEIRSNDTLKTTKGTIIKFEEKAFERVKRNRKLKNEKGIVVNFEEIVEAKRRGRPSKSDIESTEGR